MNRQIPYIPQKFFKSITGMAHAQWHSQSIVDPCQVFNTLYTSFRPIFLRKIGNIERFWKQVKNDDPRLANHPMLAIDDWEKKAVPITIHLDSATFTKTQNAILSVQWSFMLDGRFSMGECNSFCNALQGVPVQDIHS